MIAPSDEPGKRTAPPRPFVPPYTRTDVGNSERFIARCGSDVHYIATWKKWYTWTGSVWSEDTDGAVNRLAVETLKAIEGELKSMAEEDRPAWYAHMIASQSNLKVRAMLRQSESIKGVTVTPEQFDADPLLLNVANGVLDLRTGQLKRHSRRPLMAKITPVAFDADLPCPLWEAFVDRCLGGDKELVAFVQRAVGYSLTGLVGERNLFFLHGNGGNGKSTFLEILRDVLAGYARQADFSTFVERKNSDAARGDVARLVGSRLVTSSEIGDGKRLDEGLVKHMTGNEVMTARFLFSSEFEFQPQFKLWLAANHRPVIRGTDDGIWDRVRLIPFLVKIPRPERDQDFKTKLRAELPGILAWCVAGCLEWQAKGLGAAEQESAATSSYRRESDTLGAFLDECTETELHNPECAVRSTDVYAAYRRWAEDGGEFVMSQTRFGRELEERGYRAEKRGRDTARVKWRVGLRLTVSLFPESRRSSKGDDDGAF